MRGLIDAIARRWRRPGPLVDLDADSEVGKSLRQKRRSGFCKAYLSGHRILDIGVRGVANRSTSLIPNAIGIDLDYPGYDGVHLPFGDATVDAVFSSHMLEHAADPLAVIRDWHRVIKVGGFIVCVVPHQFLYERRREPPSPIAADHKRFYTPGRLLDEFEAALEPNSYRVRHLADNDAGYDYGVPLDAHPLGCYEIELVVEKITPPAWRIA